MIHQKNNLDEHIPVLVEPVLKYLDPKPGETYLDLTAGYGGHSSAILERTKNPSGTILVDRDKEAIAALKKRFSGKGVQFIEKDFLVASRQLQQAGQTFDLVLADLGVSSPHFNKANRGFSIAQEGPLDMRMDQTDELTADTIVNNYSEAELADVIRRFGEDPKAAKIANLIVQHRPIKTTTELANIVARAWPGYHKINPATRTFQAIRIAVNDELNQLEQSLPIWVDLLTPGGRIAIISFHSLEDRLVKQAFQDRSVEVYDASIQLLTKRPITGDKQETAFNPRARSAKLRAAVKIKTKGSYHANSGKKQLPNL